jgi:RimJ/RimL family protein N-acetyltransferase
MANPIIRLAGVDDAATLADLGARTFHETFAPDNRPEDVTAYVRSAFGEAIQRAELADPACLTWLVDMDGAPAGYAQLWLGPAPEDIAAAGALGRGAIELKRFYIDRAWHGRGLAQPLLDRVTRAAAERGAPALWLGVWEQNPRAIAFYRKCGFLDVGSHVFLLGQDAQTDRLMVRPLASPSSRPRAPERVFTPRLVLERPRLSDAEAIFSRYASDPEVTRYVAFPRHHSVDTVRTFLTFSDAEWEREPAGAYLIRARTDGQLLGGTGLGFETPFRASTGYVLARDAWGQGYASEALLAMVDVARVTLVRRLYALVHPEHQRSMRVLERCGFTCEGTLQRHDEFPNLSPGEPSDVRCYVRLLESRHD